MIDHYEPDILTAQDYYPFGMLSRVAVPGSGQTYKFGFNGKMNDNDVKGGLGNQQDYGMRIYDPRVGRFLSVDPITRQYPELTPYQFASNRPIDGVDLDGKEYSAITDWLADKAKASGNPRLSGFIRSFGAGDVNTQAFNLMDNVAKGNFKAAAVQVLSYTGPGMQVGLAHTVKNAYNGDKEAQGELIGIGTQAVVGGVIGRGRTFSEVVDEPITVTNKQAASANGGKVSVDPMMDAMSKPLRKPLPSLSSSAFEPVVLKNGIKGGKQLNKAIKEIVAGGGTPRVDPTTGTQTVFEGRTASNGSAWNGALEYEVQVPEMPNQYRILRLQTGVDGNGAPIFKYGYSIDHYQTTIHEFKPVQPPPASTGNQ